MPSSLRTFMPVRWLVPLFDPGTPLQTGPRSDAPTPALQSQVSLRCRPLNYAHKRGWREEEADDVALRFNKSISLCDQYVLSGAVVWSAL